MLPLYFCRRKNITPYMDVRTRMNHKLFPIMGLLAGFLVLCCVGCGDKEKRELRATLEDLYGREVALDTGRMRKFSPSECLPCGRDAHPLLRVVSYVDTAACSPCMMNDLYNWRGFLDSLGVYRGRIGVCFIYDAPRSKLRETIEEAGYLSEDMGIPLYVDTLHLFAHANRLPLPPNTHVFVIDKDNRVCLVGNPVRSPKVGELFWEEVEELDIDY